MVVFFAYQITVKGYKKVTTLVNSHALLNDMDSFRETCLQAIPCVDIIVCTCTHLGCRTQLLLLGCEPVRQGTELKAAGICNVTGRVLCVCAQGKYSNSKV